MNVLVVIAHPDDETFGLGATISRHVQEFQDNVFVLSLSSGVGSRENSIKTSEEKLRKDSFVNASTILGYKIIEPENYFPDNMFDTVGLLPIIKEIEKVKDSIKPSLVYSHSINDLNIDHSISAQAVITAFRPQPNEVCREIRAFEIPSSSDYSLNQINGSGFSPNLYVNIKKFYKNKEKALLAYGAELREAPHSRSLHGIKSLINLRGVQCGCEMAEAFEVYRKFI